MSAALGLWEFVLDEAQPRASSPLRDADGILLRRVADDAAVNAIARGLRAVGYAEAKGAESYSAEWSWPEWACAVYYATEVDGPEDVAVVRAVSTWPEEDREALVAADALGGSEAVRGILRAQGDPPGGGKLPARRRCFHEDQDADVRP